jgi:Asp/Glu/hydantoin racemase
VACYSVHPLVTRLAPLLTPNTPITGIFEASISTALIHLSSTKTARFGIVTTGSYWEPVLSAGVNDYLGVESTKRFKGVFSTGLSAGELHTTPQEEV